MSAVEREIKELIIIVVAEYLQNINQVEPVFIRIEEAADICSCDRSVIDALIQDSLDNGFPSVKLSSKTTRIDKKRFYNWLQKGGLNKIKTI